MLDPQHPENKLARIRSAASEVDTEIEFLQRVEPESFTEVLKSAWPAAKRIENLLDNNFEEIYGGLREIEQ